MDNDNLTKKEKRELAKEEKRKQEDRKVLMGKVRKGLVITGILLALGFSGYKFIKWVNTPTPDVAGESITANEEDWKRGAEDAQVVLIEYGDFQCPACRSYYPIVKQLEEEYPDSLQVIYRHYPLIQIHNNALSAARAAEAAGRQGKFWEMHDKLYENQDDWAEERNPSDKFKTFATDIGLDMEKFESDYNSQEVEDRVNEERLSALGLGLRGTPSFILNGEKIDNPQGYEAFKAQIESAMNK